MKLFNMIFGNSRKGTLDLLSSEEASPAPSEKPKYWTRHNLNWSTAKSLEVVRNDVYLHHKNDKVELIATRIDNRTAYGYADALARNHRVPILGDIQNKKVA
jgi:hypothetical protein